MRIVFRLLFAAILMLFGVVMILIAPEEHRMGYYTFSLLCFSIIGAWFAQKEKIFYFCTSLIATIVLITVIFCLAHVISTDSSLSIFNVIIWVVLFGYPSLRHIINAKFGFFKNETEEKFIEQGKSFKEENNE